MTISDYSSYTEALFSIISLVSVNQCHALVYVDDIVGIDCRSPNLPQMSWD